MASRFKLDEIDHKILDMLIENTRMPFTDIAKALDVSAGTIHIRVRKMEESGIIKSSTLTVDYDKIGYTFVAYVGIFLEKNHQTQFVIERLTEIPYITQASIISGKYNILCKIRARDTKHAKEIIFMIDDIQGVYRTESMISMEESISDKKRLLHTVFKELLKEFCKKKEYEYVILYPIVQSYQWNHDDFAFCFGLSYAYLCSGFHH